MEEEEKTKSRKAFREKLAGNTDYILVTISSAVVSIVGISPSIGVMK